MSVSVRIDDALVEEARTAAKAEYRTVQGQIEFWAKVGRAALDTRTCRPVSSLRA